MCHLRVTVELPSCDRGMQRRWGCGNRCMKRISVRELGMIYFRWVLARNLKRKKSELWSWRKVLRLLRWYNFDSLLSFAKFCAYQEIIKDTFPIWNIVVFYSKISVSLLKIPVYRYCYNRYEVYIYFALHSSCRFPEMQFSISALLVLCKIAISLMYN